MSSKNYLSIYAKSFNWAGFFLPKKTYQKCSSLYDFCRTVDDIADDQGKLDIKKKNLLFFESSTTSLAIFVNCIAIPRSIAAFIESLF